MKRALLLGLGLLAACATAPPAETSAVRARLEALPRCEAGARVGVLRVRATVCTKRSCQAACCNRCSWAARFEGKDGPPAPADAAVVQALLGVEESALDCELTEWGEALRGQLLSLDAPGCRGR